MSSIFRSPRTTQERKYNQEEWFDGYFVPIRGKRKPHKMEIEVGKITAKLSIKQ